MGIDYESCRRSYEHAEREARRECEAEMASNLKVLCDVMGGEPQVTAPYAATYVAPMTEAQREERVHRQQAYREFRKHPNFASLVDNENFEEVRQLISGEIPPRIAALRPPDDARGLAEAIFDTVGPMMSAAMAMDIPAPVIECPHDDRYVGQLFMGCRLVLCRGCHAALLMEYL